MTRPRSALRGRTLVALFLLLPAAAEDPPVSTEHQMLVATGAAPVIDGQIGESEWEGATTFTVRRGTEVFGNGWMRRTGRQLYVAFDTALPPWAIGLRFNFGDPMSGRSNLVLVTPVNPRTPLTAFRHLVDQPADRVSAAAADIRFKLPEKGFSFEMRLPLDLLEIAPTDATYRFSLEVWALVGNRALAAYPQDPDVATVEARPIPIRSEGAWGAEDEAGPPEPGALAFLEEIADTPEGEPAFAQEAGWATGQRDIAALAALEARAVKLAKAYPDLIALHAFLVHVRIAMNDLEGALDALDTQAKMLSWLAEFPRNRMVRSRILRDLGRYDEALAVLEKPEEVPEVDAKLETERHDVTGLRDAWRIEKRIREAEAARDDLPRVRLKTSKGEIDIELFEDDAPNAVANFISVVESGLYDGTRFHWSAGGDRIIGGDPNSKDDDPHNDGFGDPGYMIESEPGRRMTFPMTVGFVDKRRHRRTEGCAFAIYFSSFPAEDGINTVLGRVIGGEDAVQKISYYDTIEKATVLRKRDHPYTPVKR